MGEIYAITSVVPQNGAKYLATNLSYFITKNRKNRKKRVLLIDFDFLNPSLGYRLAKDHIYSIDNLNLEESELSSEIVEKVITSTELGFDILKGTSLYSPELFSNELIAEVLNTAKRNYDFIFVVVNPDTENRASVISFLNAKKNIVVIKNDCTNELKIDGVLDGIVKTTKNKENIEIVYNYGRCSKKAEIVNKIRKYEIKPLAILDYSEKVVDNANLRKKFSKKSVNDRKIKLICKKIVK